MNDLPQPGDGASAPPDVRQRAEERARHLAASYDLDGFLEQCRVAHDADQAEPIAGMQYAEALGYVGRFDEKTRLLEALLAIEPQHAHLNLCYALELLAQGRHRDAWRHFAYRAAFKNVIRPDPGLPPERIWRGEPLAGKRIALISEQGLGDTLQYVRYAIDLQRAGAMAYLNVQPALRPLLTGSPSLGVVLTPAKPTEINYWARLIDLLPVTAPTRDDVKWPGAYVSPPAAPAPAALKASDRAGGLRVGLAWRGNPAFPSNYARSMALETLAPIQEARNCRFFSLMPPEAAEEIQACGAGAWLTDLSPISSPFEELARAVAAMDVVVSVCTSIAHLAASMGKPTFLMLSALPDWRWARSGEATPWYPSVRLFRQTRFGRWDDVVWKISETLQGL